MEAGRRSDPPPITANPGLGFTVCVAWYALVVAAFLAVLARQSDVSAPDCAGTDCFTDRFGWLMVGLFIGAPTVFVAFIVSLVVLGLLAARSRITSAVALGTAAATPALLLLGVLVSVALAS
jgi:hypothetical protein